MVGRPRERRGDPDAQGLPPHPGEHGLQDLVHVLLGGERHLQVELGELPVAVGPEVLVPEASDQLVVPVDTGDHQELFELLRGLGQGVHPPPLEPRRHQEVAGPLGRALREHRRLDVEEPVGEPEDLVHVDPILHRERGRVALGEDLDGARGHLDLSRPEARVRRSFRPPADLPDHPEHGFVLHPRSDPVRLGRLLRMGHHLHQSLAVAQVEENHPSVIAAPGHPAGQDDLLASVLGPELPAHVGPPTGKPGAHVPASPAVAIHAVASSSASSRCSPSESLRRVTVPAPASRSPTITANRAPARFAAFIWAPSGRSSNPLAADAPASRRARRTSTTRARPTSPTETTNASSGGSSGGATSSSCSASLTRSSPIANPTPRTWGPPRASARPSYRPPPNSAAWAWDSTELTTSNAVRV